MLRNMARTSKNSDPILDPDAAQDLASAGRFKQIRMVAGLVNKANPKALPITIGSGLGTVAILIIVGLLTGLLPIFIPLAILFGVLVTVVLFGRFAQSAQYSAIEGQLGAPLAVLRQLRGSWTVTEEPVAANRNMDVVYRVVGRPGVILVGEGSPHGLASLLAAEKKKVARVAYEVPIFEFQVGNADGQVPISKLQRKIMRLPRNLKPDAVRDINHRLRALAPMQGPKGPIPRNVRQPKMPRPKNRLLLRKFRWRDRRDYTRTTTVSAARSCRPRRSRSTSSAGMTHSSSSVRTADQPKPTGSPLRSTVTTLMPNSRFPIVKPPSAVPR
jgi:hypothetical protein